MPNLIDLAKSQLTTSVSGTINSATTFAVTNATQKVGEAASSMLGTFNGTADFKKIAAEATSFERMQADSLLKDSGGAKIAALSDVNAKILGAEPSVSATDLKRVLVIGKRGSQHRVRLTELGARAQDKTPVFFDVMPEIVENHVVDYEPIAPPQFPGAFQKYKGNPSTQWTLNAMFIARTQEEAERNYKYLMKLRGWTKPFFGERTGKSYNEKLGAPPPILMLEGLRTLVGPTPVVITSLSWTWPKDVDYISTGIDGPDGRPIPFPTVLSVPIQLVETYSIEQFNQFSLEAYRAGDMVGAYKGAPASTTQVPPDQRASTPTPEGSQQVAAPLPPSSKPEDSAAAVKELEASMAKLQAEVKEIDDAAIAFYMSHNSTDAERDQAIEFGRASASKSALKKREINEIDAKISSLRNT